MKQVGIIFWVFGCLIQCRIGTVSRIIFGIAWELFDIWTHLNPAHFSQEDKQEGLTQQLISDMFLKMTLTLGLQNGRCDDCDETFGFESIFQLFVTATCRKFFSGRAVDEDLFHLFQFISIFVCLRGGSIPGDLWVCQRWIVFLVAARSERVKHRSSQLMQLPWNWCPKGCVTRCRRRTAKIPNGAWMFWCKLSRPHHCACQLI